MGHPKRNDVRNFRRSELLFMIPSRRFVLRSTYGIEIIPFILGQQSCSIFLQLMNLFFWALGERKELVI